MYKKRRLGGPCEQLVCSTNLRRYATDGAHCFKDKDFTLRGNGTLVHKRSMGAHVCESADVLPLVRSENLDIYLGCV